MKIKKTIITLLTIISLFLIGCNLFELEEEKTDWVKADSTGSSIKSIDLLNEYFGFSVGSYNTYFYNGTSWTQENTVGDSDVKVISSTCVYTPTRFFNGSTWTNLPSERRGYSVTGTDANHIWIGDSYGEIHFYNGSSWETIDLDYSRIYSIDAYSDQLVYAIDSNGKIIKYNGVGWSQVSDLLLSSSNNNPKIKVINSSEFWVVCDKKIYKFLNNQLNNTWTMSENVYCVEGTASNNIWFGGANGKIWLYNGSDINAQSTPNSCSIYDIEIKGNLKLAVGSNGIILKKR